ncbi:MAG: hypothetical protein Terrestrivirus13_12 [Terrestrivirus sp.]|uniref:Uncharacterized protein n=1 Tax=Terrestrivirus sp. TaxID=2487775 RepID=A0A3G4ZPD6_9VIRU|nr:MAG: hypothetical protein Terrestrivirus13_12 [Terrestrivirus sp.]
MEQVVAKMGTTEVTETFSHKQLLIRWFRQLAEEEQGKKRWFHGFTEEELTPINSFMENEVCLFCASAKTIIDDITHNHNVRPLRIRMYRFGTCIGYNPTSKIVMARNEIEAKFLAIKSIEGTVKSHDLTGCHCTDPETYKTLGVRMNDMIIKWFTDTFAPGIDQSVFEGLSQRDFQVPMSFAIMASSMTEIKESVIDVSCLDA